MLALKVPKITPTPVDHRNYKLAKHTFGTFCRNDLIDKVVVLVGPTQSGKSTILAQCYHESLALAEGDDAFSPTIGMKIESSNDGRVTQRFMLLQTLKELRHPVYEHIGDLDELDFYVPRGSRDETSMRIAAGSSLSSRKTQKTYLDEAHHLMHTTDAHLQDRLLQSVKTLFAVDRTLYMAGGYELAYKGCLNSPHLSGRLAVVELRAYSEDVPKDLQIFAEILLQWESHIPVKKPGVLAENAPSILRANNGIIGRAEFHVLRCKLLAEAAGRKIDEDLLFEQMPTERSRLTIADDITKGREALALCDAVVELKEGPNEEAPSAAEAKQPPKRKAKPFTTNPKRRRTGLDHIKVEKGGSG
jgi:hypothetical protein